MTIQENVPLAPLTTLLVGGSARYFAELRREDDLREAAQFAKTRTLPLFVLGGGSNLVVADSGWPGLVLRVAIGGITTQTTDASANAVLFTVGAVGYGLAQGQDLFAVKLRTGDATAPGPGFHFAFAAPSREAVARFHAEALAHGGRDNGAPGLRPAYGPDYFAAFVIDPDGYRIEAVITSAV